MFRFKLWCTMGAILLWAPIAAIAQQVEENQAVLKISPPEIKRIEPPPKPKYSTGEFIDYLITVHLPESSDQIRINPPTLDLENLELLGVSQETVSAANGSLFETSGIDQILNFRFVSKNPGPAKIKKFLLRWIYGDGTLTNDFSLQPIELTITTSPSNWKFFLSISAFILICLGLAGGFWRLWKRKRAPASNSPALSLEDAVLNEFHSVYARLQSKNKSQDFLSKVRHIFEGYLSQKFDWNPVRVDYNELQKKIEEKWSKKEAKEINEIFSALEYEQFSGSKIEQDKLEKLYQEIYSLIDRKK